MSLRDPSHLDLDVLQRGMALALVRSSNPPERIILAFSSEGPYPYSNVLAA